MIEHKEQVIEINLDRDKIEKIKSICNNKNELLLSYICSLTNCLFLLEENSYEYKLKTLIDDKEVILESYIKETHSFRRLLQTVAKELSCFYVSNDNAITEFDSTSISEGKSVLVLLSGLHGQNDFLRLMRTEEHDIIFYFNLSESVLHIHLNYKTRNWSPLLINKMISLVLSDPDSNLASLFSVNFDESVQIEDGNTCFPLTDIQTAYWIAKNEEFQLSGFSTHGYMEIRTTLDIKKLNACLQLLIKRHAMLRSVVLPSGKQQVLKDVPLYEIENIDLTKYSDEVRNQKLIEYRDKWAHYDFDIEKWPLFNFKALKISPAWNVLAINWDMVAIDGLSMELIGKELLELYYSQNGEIDELKSSFSDYVQLQLSNQRLREFKLSEQFWMNKLENFPTYPLIPSRKNMNLDQIKRSHFRPLVENFSEEEWLLLEKISRASNATISSFLCTIYAKVLSYWSNQPKLALNLTTFNRPESIEDINRIIGDFTTLTILDIDFSESLSFQEEVSKVQRTLFENLQHRRFDGVRFIRELAKKRGLQTKVIAPIVFTSLLEKDVTSSWEGIGNIDWELYETPQVFLDCIVVKREKGFKIVWNYVEEVYEEEVIRKIFNQFSTILRACLKGSFETFQFIEPVKEDKSFIAAFNNTHKDIQVTTLHQLFTKQAKMTPNHVALRHNDKFITYREIDEMSNQVARYFLSQSINGRIAIKVKRDILTIVNILGVLKAGAAYVPFEEDYPQDRVQYILEKSGSEFVIDSDFYRNAEIHLYDNSEIEINIDNSALAYILYTSGSTGKPKGVAISHGAVVNTIQDINDKFNVTHEDEFLLISSICFDLSVYDMFGCFSKGAALTLIDDPRDMFNILQVIESNKITIWNSVPAVLELFLELDLDKSDVSSIRLIMLSGDFINKKMVNKAKGEFLNSQIISLGGATEASIWSIYYPIVSVDSEWRNIPYGIPLCNQQFYVLNYEKALCPVGVQGELYIGGVGIAEGYYGEEEKTDASFILDERFGRIYKTGDFGKLNEHGYIEFIGREDNQVKINGYRIELEEITKLLLDLDHVENAIVTKYEEGKTVCLVAYIIRKTTYNKINFREYLSTKIPNYMIPKYFIELEEFKLTSNGKIDYKSLPLPNVLKTEKITTEDEYVSEISSLLVDIWKIVFNNSHINVDDDFFDLGGDSILSIQIVTKAKQKGLNLSVRDIFECRTIREISSKTEYKFGNDIDQSTVTGHVNLTPIQKWFFETQKYNVNHWNQSILLQLNRELDFEVLKSSMNYITNHHDALRLTFGIDRKGGWYQFNNDLSLEFELKLIELENINELNLMREQESLDIQKGPLFKPVYIRCKSDAYLLIVTHHLVVDTFSWRIILEDLQRVYLSLESSSQIDLPLKTSSYKVWSEQLTKYSKSNIDMNLIDYWNGVMDNSTSLKTELVYSGESFEKDTVNIAMFIDKDTSKKILEKTTKRLRANIKDILLASLFMSLVKRFKTSSITFNLEAHGREDIFEHIDISRTVGWFTSMFPMNLTLNNTDIDNIGAIKLIQNEFDNIPNGGIDFGILNNLRDDIDKKDILNFVGFNYLGQFDQLFNASSFYKKNLLVNESNFNQKSLRFNLIDVVVLLINGELRIYFYYNKNQFTSETIQDIATMMKENLLQIESDRHFPDAQLSQDSLEKILSIVSGGSNK